MRRHQCVVIFGGKRWAAREHLIKDDGEAIEIGPLVHIASSDLFRCGIKERPEPLARSGAPLGTTYAGDPEIHDLQHTVETHNQVCGLDVPVDYPLFMSVRQPAHTACATTARLSRRGSQDNWPKRASSVLPRTSSITMAGC